MTPDQASALLSSSRSSDRRLAAREVTSNPRLLDQSVIESAIHRETVPQIRQQLVSALESLTAGRSPEAEPPAEQAKEISEQAYVKAVRSVTERVLHQINPLIGEVEQAARSEIDDFAKSKTSQ